MYAMKESHQNCALLISLFNTLNIVVAVCITCFNPQYYIFGFCLAHNVNHDFFPETESPSSSVLDM